MRMIAPHGFSGMSHAGMTISASSDGVVEVPNEMAETMKAHGFRPWSPDPNVDMLDRNAIEKNLLDRYHDHLRTLSVDELREELNEQVAEHKREGEAKNAEKLDVSNVTEADVDRMSRNDLFAYLKAKGVAVSLPITNDELRSIARRTVRGEQPEELRK